MRTSRNLIQWIEVWNRKLHYYLGLYLLWFIWLFALSGLLLNHPKWSAADFWSKRKESTQQQSIELPERQGDLAKAKDLMGQLDLSGEIQWTTTWPSSNRFDFMVIRPGQLVQVRADLTNRVATVKRTTTNGWGILQMMHTFTGVQISDPRNQRDWLITKLWSFSMDCIVIALLFMVLSSLYMGYCLRKKWTYQAISLSLGVLCCAFFVWGLRLM